MTFTKEEKERILEAYKYGGVYPEGYTKLTDIDRIIIPKLKAWAEEGGERRKMKCPKCKGEGKLECDDQSEWVNATQYYKCPLYRGTREAPKYCPTCHQAVEAEKMDEAIKILEQEVKWHQENKDTAKGMSDEKIAGFNNRGGGGVAMPIKYDYNVIAPGIQQLRAAGLTWREIMEKTGYGFGTVQKALRWETEMPEGVRVCQMCGQPIACENRFFCKNCHEYMSNQYAGD